MFNRKHVFLSLSNLPQTIPIKLGDGKTVASSKGGPIKIKNILIQALYVPTFRVSLLSVSRLGAAGYKTTFERNICTTKNEDQRTIFTGKMENGIYILQEGHDSHTALLAMEPSTEIWHRRLGHINHEYLKTILPETSFSQISKPCNICILSKHKRAPHRKTPATRATRPFELIHSDSCSIFGNPSLSGALYYLLFIDDFTRWTYVYFLAKKNAENFTQAFNETLALIKNQYPQFPIQRFRCDNGRGEYDNQTFRKTLADNGIIFESSPPYTQNMNGVSERMIQSLNTKARSMMLDANLPIPFWAEMINTASYLQKGSPTVALEGQSPYEVLHQSLKSERTKPPIDHFRRTGCVAYHRIPNEKMANKTI